MVFCHPGEQWTLQVVSLYTRQLEPTTTHNIDTKHAREKCCIKTARLLREELKWPENKFLVTFQSRFGPEPWLQPYTDKTIIELAKKGSENIAVIAPGFISDCLETLEELNVEARELFFENGGKTFQYIPCLNDNEFSIKFLNQIIKQNLLGWD